MAPWISGRILKDFDRVHLLHGTFGNDLWWPNTTPRSSANMAERVSTSSFCSWLIRVSCSLGCKMCALQCYQTSPRPFFNLLHVTCCKFHVHLSHLVSVCTKCANLSQILSTFAQVHDGSCPNMNVGKSVEAVGRSLRLPKWCAVKRNVDRIWSDVYHFFDS